MRLPQNLIDQGGPSEFTIRKLERGETEAIRPKTKSQIERALGASDGWVDRILTGTATPEDLDPTVRHERGHVHDSATGTDSVSVVDVPAQLNTLFTSTNSDGSRTLEVTGHVFVTSEDVRDLLRGFGFNVAIGDTFTADRDGTTVTFTVPGRSGETSGARPISERRTRHTGAASANLGHLDASAPGPTAALRQTVSGVGGIPSEEAVGTPTVGSRAPRHVSDLTLTAWLVERLERRHDELKPSEKDLHAAARAALADLPSRPPQ